VNLTIFAATVGIGRQLLEQAVAAGHAVVRNSKGLSSDVRVVTADLAAADPAALESAVAGADAVLSGLGPRSTSETCPARSLGSTGRATTPVRRGPSCLPAQFIDPIWGGREKGRQSCAR
jgi:hypothetical protein